LFFESSILTPLEIKIIFCSLIFFLVGIIDDKINLSPNLKFLFLITILSIFLIFEENLILINLELWSYNISFTYELGLVLTILCILLFVNALNLFDGINLQSILYSAYVLFYLIFKNHFVVIIIVLLITLFLIGFLNYKNETFMGDGGTLFLGSMISLLVIANYNVNKSLKVDEIFLLMLIPGLDMLRLFIHRIFLKKNPFNGDRLHLHHYFLAFFGYKTSIIFLISFSLLPSALNLFFSSHYLIILFIVIYLLIIIFFLRKKNLSKY